MDFYAHSVEGQSKLLWQTLAEHLNATGELAAGFADGFGASRLARAAGMLHDLGKYTSEFQQRLEGGARVDHSTWGARMAKELYPRAWALLAYGIAGHHAGLANGRNGHYRTSLDDRFNANLPELLPQWKQDLSLPASSTLTLPDGFSVQQERIRFQQSVLARMIFSCLVDADFIDTDEFYRRAEGKPSRQPKAPPTLEALHLRLQSRLSRFKADSHVNQLRAGILSHVRSGAVLSPGLFSLTVPTGGGKTLASLAFALEHAIRHGLKRVIYVIPFTSIVEQNAEVMREAFGDLGDDAVLEHHSAFIEDAASAFESKEKRRIAMENWDAPIIVTTAVQFFESLFADRPSRCRKLHRIASSVVILDEAQTMPLKLLRPSVAMLGELALNYRSSIVLCTATQPALSASDGFHHGLQDLRELAPDPPKLYEVLRRVDVCHIGALEDEALIGQLGQFDQVLCIVNNRRHARAVYEALSNQEGALHLSTLMYAGHRRHVLAEVRRRLRDGEPCRLVSTSLIEAGVDVDFPVVFRAEAGLDSVAQAAGRCNREGKRPRGESKTLVFATTNPDWAPPVELKQYAQVFREVLRTHGADLLAPDSVRAYFQALYWQKGGAALDAHDLLGMLGQSTHDSLPFETVAAKFRMIESVMCPIIIPFNPGNGTRIQEVDQALDDLEYASGAARRLQPYLVQVPRKAFDVLRKAGAIQAVAAERYGDQFMVLQNSDLYCADFGLRWDDPAFIRAESAVI